ncbi:hypothetical protein CPB83DRAFT_504308 [Crepidotus variabilis]|uniref:Uncharacterized protein n=1 Tax=Crepidotus variabilis TaxID=179855 RepID=A0A9P6EBK6_9AGAR|nr:hypothetical protein CPB83DRAFT_504308 [Crepidotus variabilis]
MAVVQSQGADLNLSMRHPSLTNRICPRISRLEYPVKHLFNGHIHWRYSSIHLMPHVWLTVIAASSFLFLIINCLLTVIYVFKKSKSAVWVVRVNPDQILWTFFYSDQQEEPRPSPENL